MALGPSPDTPQAWEVLLKLSTIMLGMDGLSTKAVDDIVFRQFVTKTIKRNRQWEDLRVDEVLAKLDGLIGPERIVDMLLRIGPYGDGFGRRPDGLTLLRVQEAEHWLDLGALQPRLRELINTKSDLIELVPEAMRNDLPRFERRWGNPLKGCS